MDNMENLSLNSSDSIVLSVENLTKSFGTKRVLTKVTFNVNKGEIFGLLGPNGSGKTTTIKLILGLLNMQGGAVKICGHDIKTDFEKAISNVGAIVENPEMYKYLTGRQNLMQYCRMYDNCSLETIEWAINVVGLNNRIDEKVSRYSLGMRQRLGIAQALINNPKILLLDEPTNGLDPEGIKGLREFLISLAHEKGVSVLVSSHLLSELENLCDRVGVINSGRIVGIKTMEEIRSFGQDGLVAYKIKVDNAENAEKYFNDNQIEYKVQGERMYLISITEEMADSLIEEMSKNGVHLRTFAPIERTLEDAFMDMISNSGGSEYEEHFKISEK